MTRCLRIVAIAAGIALSSGAAAAPAMAGEVVEVEGGDTLTVLMGAKRVRVLIAEIDAPEARQSFGDRAMQSLTELCLKKTASVQALGQAAGRVIARVHCDAVDAASHQVKHGMAWVSTPKRNVNSPLYYLQDQAQRGREGLWKEASPVAPWVWRKTPASRRPY